MAVNETMQHDLTSLSLARKLRGKSKRRKKNGVEAVPAD
jgi:hypothetical protein